MFFRVKREPNSIFISDKIEVRSSNFKNGGHGVFAKSNIKSGEIIEIAKFLRVGIGFYNIPESIKSVVYMYPRLSINPQCVIVLGYGSIYNSSIGISGRNADWVTNEESELFQYRAIKDIKKGEEILIYYNNFEF